MNDEWKEEYKKRYVPNCGDDEVCIAFWKDNIDFIDQALVSQKQEFILNSKELKELTELIRDLKFNN